MNNASMATELFQPSVEFPACNTTVNELDLASIGMRDKYTTVVIVNWGWGKEGMEAKFASYIGNISPVV